MRKNFSWKVVAFWVCLALLLAAAPASARQGEQLIKVFFHNIKIRFKGTLVPTPEEPFIYQGRVYVPLRFVAETLGQEVRWDPATWMVVIGEKPSATYLSDLKAYRASDYIWYDDEAKMQMGGKRYLRGIQMTANPDTEEYDFNLNGQYTRLTGLLGVDDDSEEGAYTVTFLGDGKPLGTFEFSKGDLPKPVSLDVSRVLRLTIKANQHYDFPWSIRGKVDFADALLE